MSLIKEDIQNRIKEIQAAIAKQSIFAQQISNQVLMFQGAEQELVFQLNNLIEKEKLASLPDNSVKTVEPINHDFSKEEMNIDITSEKKTE